MSESKNKFNEAKWWRDNFPSGHARDAADKVVDAMDTRLPMEAFLDAWLAAYKAAGGWRPKR